MKDLELRIVRMCGILEQNVTLDNAFPLVHAIRMIESKDVVRKNAFINRVLFPVINVFGDIKGINVNEVKTILCLAIQHLLGFLNINQILGMKSILVILLKELHEFQTGDIKNISEEFKVNLIECIDALFRCVTFNVVEEFYDQKNVAVVSQLLFVLCAVTDDTEAYKKLRTAAVSCMMAILYIHDETDFTDVVLRAQISNIVFIFLPKLFMSFFDCALGEEKNGIELITLSIKALGRYLCLIMEDYNNEEQKKLTSLNNDFKTLQMGQQQQAAGAGAGACSRPTHKSDCEILFLPKIDDEQPKREIFDSISKTSEWLNAAARQLTPALLKLHILICKESDAIRLEVATFVCSIIEKCSFFMSSCMPTLIEACITLSNDSNVEIRNKCLATIKYIELKTQMEPLLNPIFIKTLSLMPRILHTGSETEQIAHVLLFKGVLKLMANEQLKTLLYTPNVLESLVTHLQTTVTIEESMDLLQNEYTIRLVDEDFTMDSHGNNNLPWKVFRYSKTDKFMKEIEKTCEIIGNSSAFDSIFNCLFVLFGKREMGSNEIILLFIFLLRNMKDKKKQQHYIDTILDEYNDLIHWDLELQPNQVISTTNDSESGESSWFEDRTAGLYESAISVRYTDIRWSPETNTEELDDGNLITINEAKFNVLHQCLILESFGEYAKILGPQKSQPNILLTLSKILEKAGSSNYMLHVAGMYALKCYTQCLRLSSISEFIHSNIDYALLFINNSIKNIENTKRILDTLSVIIKYGPLDTIVHLESIILTVIRGSSNSREPKSMKSCIKVFRMILQNILQSTNDVNSPIYNPKIVINNEIDYKNEHTPEGIVKMKTDFTQEWTEFFNKWNGKIINDDMKESQRKLSDPKSQSIENGESICWDKQYFENSSNQKDTTTEVDIKMEGKNDDDDDDDKREKNDGIEEVKEIPLPKHVQMAVNILRRCLKCISSINREEKILAIDAVTIGINIIRNYENELLPMVHTIWQPLVQRMSDKDPIVIRRCFALLVLLAKLSKDFIHRRTSTEILPKICTFLSKSAIESLAHGKDPSYANSQQCKLASEVLAGLPNIMIHVDVSEHTINLLLELVSSFLNVGQPKVLQEKCIEFYEKLKPMYGATLYVKLFDYRNDPKYSVNVRKIFDYIN